MQWSNAKHDKRLDMARKLADGIETHQDRLAGRGLDEAFVKEMRDLKENIEKLGRQQTDLRQELLNKTKELHEHFDRLESKYREGKSLIKIEFDRSQWVKFGFHNKR